MFEFGKVDFIGECSNGNKVLVFKVFYTVDEEAKEVPFLVYDDGTYKTSIEELFEQHTAHQILNDLSKELGMSRKQKEEYLSHVKYLINKWCRDLGYPKIEKNIFTFGHDDHLM